MDTKNLRKLDLFVGVFLTLIFLIFLINIDKYIYGGIQGSISPTLLPKIIVCLVILLSIIMIITSILSKNKIRISETIKDENVSKDIEIISNKNIIAYMLILFSYLFLLYIFGFIISTPLVMFCTMFLLGGRNIKVILPLVIICPPLLNYLCYKFLKVMLPQGLLFG